MISDVDLLEDAMRKAVTDAQPPFDVFARAARRHHRRTTRHRIVLTAGSATVLAVGVIASTGPDILPTRSPGAPSAQAQPSAGSPPTVVPDSSPRLRLVAALAATNRTSYALHLRNVGRALQTPRLPDALYADYQGSYDPMRRVGAGVNRLDGLSIQVRLIGDTYYVDGNPDQWTSGTGSLADALVLDGGRHWGPTDGASADPLALFRTIRDRGDIQAAGSTGTGAERLDSYRFRYPLKGDGSITDHDLTGTVQVHHESNLVAGISTRTTVVGRNPEIADGDPLTFETVITFSRYGLPVEVVAPPADQVTTVPRKQA